MISTRQTISDASGGGVIEFDPDLHVYRVNGETWPSVTTVLSMITDFDGIPREHVEAAGRFGTEVHNACHAINIGAQLAAMGERTAAYVGQYRRFLRESRIKVTHSEERVANRRLRYCGTLDLRGVLNGRPGVIDIKTSAVVPKTVGPQVTAYDDCLDPPTRNRWCLHLTANDYKLIPLKHPDDRANFLAALRCWTFKYSWSLTL